MNDKDKENIKQWWTLKDGVEKLHLKNKVKPQHHQDLVKLLIKQINSLIYTKDVETLLKLADKLLTEQNKE